MIPVHRKSLKILCHSSKILKNPLLHAERERIKVKRFQHKNKLCLKQELPMEFKLVSNSTCSPGWPQSHLNFLPLKFWHTGMHPIPKHSPSSIWIPIVFTGFAPPLPHPLSSFALKLMPDFGISNNYTWWQEQRSGGLGRDKISGNY